MNRPLTSLRPAQAAWLLLGPLLMMACRTIEVGAQDTPQAGSDRQTAPDFDRAGGNPRAQTAPSADAPRAPESAQTTTLRNLVEELYRAFSFGPGQVPDWDTQRRLFHPDCRFLGPVSAGREPQSENLEQFLDSFERYAASAERQAAGLHERILALDLWHFGGVAHAEVDFEGYLPVSGQPFSRGIDLLQLVESPAGWRIVGFTTQYARPGLNAERTRRVYSASER